MAWVHTAEISSSSFLCACYSLLAIAALLAKIAKTHPQTKSIQRYFLPFLTVGSVFRALYLGIPDHVYGGSYTPGTSPALYSRTWGLLFIQFGIFAIGNMSFFLVYVLIVYFWSSAYSSTQGERASRPIVKMFYMFFIGYAIMQITIFVCFFLVPYTTILAMHSISMTLVATCICIGYIGLWRKFKSVLQSSELRSPVAHDFTRRMHKISSVAFFGTLCWALKILTQISQVWIILARHSHFPTQWWWAVMLASFFFEELVTSSCILVILRRRHGEVDTSLSQSQSYSQNYGYSMTRNSDRDDSNLSSSSKAYGDEQTLLNGSMMSYQSMASMDSPTHRQASSDGLNQSSLYDREGLEISVLEEGEPDDTDSTQRNSPLLP